MPAPQNYEIAFSTDNVTYTALSNVQSNSLNIGRQALIDPFKPSQMTFTMRYPTGFASPNTNLVTGTWIRLRNLSTSPARVMWRGRISNVFVEYGKPYSSSVGVQDYVTVNVEGAMAQAGRLAANGYRIPQTGSYADAEYALAEVVAGSGLSIGTTYVPSATPYVDAYTANSSWLDYLNLFATTLSSTLKDGSGQIGVYTKDFVGSLPVNFSDTTNNATNQVYEDIEFTSQVENYFTEILVNTESFGQVRVTSGSAPYRTLSIDTISYNAAQATDLANYYLTMYKTPKLGLTKITCRSEAQNTWNLDMGNGSYEFWDMIGYRCNLTFRGTTYYVTIIGASLQASPAGSTVTYYLIDNALTPWFVLDSSVYGVLGTNKLSW